MRSIAWFPLAGTLVLAAGPSMAQTPAPPAENFAEANQWVVSTALDTGVRVNFPDPGPTSVEVRAGTNIGRSWALDYFIIDRLSLGGGLAFAHQASDGPFRPATNSFFLRPRVGYNFELTSLVSLWLQGGISLRHTSVDGGDSATHFGVYAQAPFLFHLKRHFFLGIGPYVEIDFTSGPPAIPAQRSVGIDGVAGFWL